MDIQNIRNHSTKTRETAEQILEVTKIKNSLSKYGDFLIGGSYALDLMYDPDIDIVIESVNPRGSSLELLNDLLSKRQFQKYEYGDFVKYQKENRPKGYIVNLIQEFNERKWEIEIWFLKTPRKKEKENLKEIKSRLSPKKRDLILTIKHQRAKRGISKHKLPSMHIHNEVLINEVKDISDISIK